MKMMKKICIFALVFVLLFSLASITVFAESIVTTGDTEAAADEKAEGGKLDMGLKAENFSDRLGYAVQGTVTGILMVFAVLTLLTLILYGSKYVFYDIPNKAKDKARVSENAGSIQPAEPIVAAPAPTTVESTNVAAEDDGALVAVITAAVAAMIESSEYKNEFVGGFRVVSFKRSEKTAWNRK